jgi:prolipoprotein diacylglyceryltransferase
MAYGVAFRLYLLLRRREGDVVSENVRWWVIAAAAVGAALGSRMLGFLENPAESWAVGDSGKTIVGGLVGGWAAVEGVKKHLGVTTATGDLLAVPLAVGIAVGRVGCFLTGLADQTYGRATSLAWGVDFGDGVRRHPTQVYEILFLIALAWVLLRMMRSGPRNGDVFKAFMIGYAGWRFGIDFLKEDVRWMGLSAIQWVCVGIVMAYGRDLRRVGREAAGSLGDLKTSMEQGS